MTHQNDYTFVNEIAEKGLDAIPELMQVLINNTTQVERSKYCRLKSMNGQEVLRAISHVLNILDIAARMHFIRRHSEESHQRHLRETRGHRPHTNCVHRHSTWIG